MTVPPPEYGEEDRLRQEPAWTPPRHEDVLPPDREDFPEHEIGQHERQGREEKYLDPEEHEAHAPGQACARCGQIITAGQDVRRLPDGQWMHEVCPAGPGGQPMPGQ
jgi:hypothetical protein